MTRYQIKRFDASVVECRVFTDNQISFQLPHVAVHSESGFNCGYDGCGPQDLAVSILAHHFGEVPREVLAQANIHDGPGLYKSLKYHLRFALDVTANIFLGDGEFYALSDEQIGHWLDDGLLS